MTDQEIEQAIATGQAKLSTEGYSLYLKATYGMQNYCSRMNALLLFLWALQGWDNLTGATNAYSENNLGYLIAKIQSI